MYNSSTETPSIWEDDWSASFVMHAHMTDCNLSDDTFITAFPRTSSDFLECCSMLDRYGWRRRLFELKALSPEWSLLVDRWADVEAVARLDRAESTASTAAVLAAIRVEAHNLGAQSFCMPVRSAR